MPATGSEERVSSIWSMLPSFDPGTDEPREYVEKVRFLQQVCPARDKSMLAPRLALLMKGTAWGQVRALDAAKLADPDHGVDLLLSTVAKREDSQEIQTFEKFEKALYKISQKSDETTMSYVNRLEVAFQDLGKVSISDMKSFILLRQSYLTSEDKKRILVMTQGELKEEKISAAMRQLSTKVLTGQTEVKKKTYPANYIEDDPEEEAHVAVEDDWDEGSAFQALLEHGDDDAALIADFEEQLIDTCQASPELANCFSAYTEARVRIRDKLKARGFWPPRKGKGRGFGGGQKGKSGKGSGFGMRRRQTLADRIANSHCRLCGAKGHWRQECPHRDTAPPAKTAEINLADFVMETRVDTEEILDDLPPGPGLEKYDGDSKVFRQDEGLSLCMELGNLLQFVSQSSFGLEADVSMEWILMADGRQSPLKGFRRELGRALRSWGRPEKVETVLMVESCPGIIDTGASKTVIGQKKIDALIRSLPSEVRAKLYWGKSSTTFRFGNNGTLASLGALYIPFGTRWMRIEVVSGGTPFLLSNAFLKGLGADVCTSTCDLRVPGSEQRIPLKVNGKGLFQVELAQVLRVVSRDSFNSVGASEVVTHVSDELAREGASAKRGAVQERRNEQHELGSAQSELGLGWSAATVSDQSHFAVPLQQPHHGRQGREARSLLRQQSRDSAVSRGSRFDGTVGGADGSHPPPSGSDYAPGLGEHGGSRRRPQGEALSRVVDDGAEVLQVDQGTSAVDQSVDQVSAALSVGSGTHRRADDGQRGHFGGRKPASSDAGSPEAAGPGAEGSSARATHLHSGGDSQVFGKEVNGGRGQADAGRDTSGEDFPAGSTGGDRTERAGVSAEGSVGQLSEECFGISRKDVSILSLEQDARNSVQLADPEVSRTPSTHDLSLMCELDTVVKTLEKQLEDLAALAQAHVNTRAPRIGPASLLVRRARLDVLEVYCNPGSQLTSVALAAGLRAQRWTREDGDLATEAGRAGLRRFLDREQPREIWVSPECKTWSSWSRLNESRSIASYDRMEHRRQQQRRHLRFCNELYWYQVERGRHFHMEQPVGSRAFEQVEVQDVFQGTLRTVFDMCMVGRLKFPGTEKFAQKRTAVHTTSRALHEFLDARFCDKGHTHQQIAGQWKHGGRWEPISRWTENYTPAFARQLVKYFSWSRTGGEAPLLLEEHATGDASHVGREQSLVMAADVVKRRRLHGKTAVPVHEDGGGHAEVDRRSVVPRPETDEHVETLRELFVRLDGQAPRVGPAVIDRNSSLFREVQHMCPRMKVEHVEVCRGTERFRVPMSDVDRESLVLRQMYILNRHTGKVESLGGPERWQRLAKTQQVRKAGPARLSLTVFGSETLGTGNLEAPAPARPAKDEIGERTAAVEDEPEVEGRPPRNVARHGPAFLRLSRDDQAWLKRVHHRMGHPAPDKLVRFLKHSHADERILAGALDLQCDTCTETQVGFKSARPAAIHERREFNTLLGMDVAIWTNAIGEHYQFLHCVDEATMFQLARPCDSDGPSQYRTFADMWMSWAGPPQEIYVDPGREYASDYWLKRMQEHDVRLSMTATDSHWQLGRAEAHGGILKHMLTRMDVDQPIRSALQFTDALVQACWAKNSLSRIDGYTPEQAVLGIARRLPASVTSSTETAALETALADSVEGDAYRHSLKQRLSARKAFLEADNSSSLQRALLRRARPVRDDYETGDWVLYWRRRGGNLRRERGQWHGPARVVLIEKRRVVWLTHGHRLVRASPEQLRPASLQEWRSAREQSEQTQTLSVERALTQARHRDYIDLDADELPPHPPDTLPETGPGSDVADDLPEPEREESARPEPMDLDPVQVPVPDEPFSEDEPLMFGDHLTFWAVDQEHVWEVDVTPPDGHELADMNHDMNHDETVLLAAEMRAKRVEVRLKDLGQDDQLRMAIAKDKELRAWLHHATIRKVTHGKIPEHALMRCRWLLTWKTASGGEAPEDLNAEGKKAKARLIVIGYEDPDIDSIANDAPTLTKDGRMMVLQATASHRWELVSFDISTAFLHGKGDGRLLGLHPTPEIREALHMSPSDQCQLDGGAYGRIDAPYLWFCELRDELLKQGCVQCPLDPCVFAYYLPDKEGRMQLQGALGVHVDDGIAGGNAAFRQMLQRLEKRFKFGAFDKGEFVYTGIRFRQWDDGSIEYDQKTYVEKIKPIPIPRERRTQLHAEVTPSERTQYRSLVGALQYAAVHTRPDLAAKISELQTRSTKCKVEDLGTANKVLAEAKEFPVSLMVLPIEPSKVSFAAFSDASFSAIKENAAHQGTLIFATTPELLENKKAVVAPVAWTSKRVDRVVRSTLGAEAAALSNSVDRLLWIRLLWSWLRNPQGKWTKPEEVLTKENPGALVTDCRSAFDLLTRTAVPQCSEHRTTIECLLIRERMRENVKVRWVASQAMLSDCLTKVMDGSALRACLETGRYSLQDESRLLQHRADQRQRLAWIKGHGDRKQTQAPTADSSSEPLQPVLVATAVQDFWTVGSKGEIIKVHRVPRTIKFTPIGDVTCPVPLRDFGPDRITIRDGVHGSERDYWAANSNTQRTFGAPWTGRTVFLRRANSNSKQETKGCVKPP